MALYKNEPFSGGLPECNSPLKISIKDKRRKTVNQTTGKKDKSTKKEPPSVLNSKNKMPKRQIFKINSVTKKVEDEADRYSAVISVPTFKIK